MPLWAANRSQLVQRHRGKMLNAIGLLIWACVSGSGCGGGLASGPPARNLLSVSVDPASAEATAPTGTLPFTATGTFDEAPTTQDNLTVQWSSSDPATATIDSSSGVATCVAAGGPVTIMASSGQKQGTAQLNCLAAPQPGSGNCVYICPSTRCGSLTGYCSLSTGGQCRQVYDPVSCPRGMPAGGSATDSCGVGVDTSRTCRE